MNGEELSRARSCHLLEKDGSRWRVLDVEFEDGRAWVTARPAEHAFDAGGGGRGNGGREPRIFETVLEAGARLEWVFPDGRRVRAFVGEQSGDLRWERGDVIEEPSYFRDPFLA